MPDAAALDQMYARDQIRDLVSRYVIAIDSSRFEDLAALFDPEMDSEKYGKGQEGVRAWYQQVVPETPNPSGLYHSISAHQIDLIDEDNATGVLYQHGVGVADGIWHAMAGIYRDRYVRRGDRWYFAQRNWAHVGSTDAAPSDFNAAAWAPSTAEVWKMYEQDRAERLARG